MLALQSWVCIGSILRGSGSADKDQWEGEHKIEMQSPFRLRRKLYINGFVVVTCNAVTCSLWQKQTCLICPKSTTVCEKYTNVIFHNHKIQLCSIWRYYKKKKKKERKISYVTQKYEDQQVSANHKGWRFEHMYYESF